MISGSLHEVDSPTSNYHYPSLNSSSREVLVINNPKKANHNLMTYFDYNPSIDSFSSKSQCQLVG